jgi:hypothetical protein
VYLSSNMQSLPRNDAVPKFTQGRSLLKPTVRALLIIRCDRGKPDFEHFRDIEMRDICNAADYFTCAHRPQREKELVDVPVLAQTRSVKSAHPRLTTASPASGEPLMACRACVHRSALNPLLEPMAAPPFVDPLASHNATMNRDTLYVDRPPGAGLVFQ